MCTRVVNYHCHVRAHQLYYLDTPSTTRIIRILSLQYLTFYIVIRIINYYKVIIDHFVRKIIINAHNIILFDVPREYEFVLLYQQHNNIVVFIFVSFFYLEKRKRMKPSRLCFIVVHH